MSLPVLSLGQASPAGAAIGVSYRGEYMVEVGGVCGNDGTPVDVDTCFDLASVTKVVATICILHRLAELGQITLDDRVSRYLPWVPDQITVRNLAYHRGGMWEWQPLYLSGENPRQSIMDLPLRYGVDKERHYSDLGFMVLGFMIEAAAGVPLDTAFSELIASPVGLTRTGFGPADESVASGGIGDLVEQGMVRSGEPYPILFSDQNFPWRSGETRGEANDGNAFHAYSGVAGHAGLFSTVVDLLRLLVSLASQEDLWGETSAAVFADGPDPGQGFGWKSMPIQWEGQPRRMLWHPGFTGCAAGFIPHEDCTVVMLTNRLLAPNPTTTESLWRTTLSGLTSMGIDLPNEGMPT